MNEDHELEMIQSHVVRFRRAIDAAKRDDCKDNMKMFPKACCHHACSLLLLYFKQIGLEGFHTIEGKHPVDRERKHLWLEKDQIVVDITADQFNGIENRAIITRNSPWHETLNGKRRPPEDPKQISDYYADIYPEIIKMLPP